MVVHKLRHEEHIFLIEPFRRLLVLSRSLFSSNLCEPWSLASENIRELKIEFEPRDTESHVEF